MALHDSKKKGSVIDPSSELDTNNTNLNGKTITSKQTGQHIEDILKHAIQYRHNRVAEGQDTLQINDIVFSVPRVNTPPTNIRVEKEIYNHKWQTLRTRGAQKRSSGHGNIRISFELYFVGGDAINTGLRRLLVSFDTTPFVFIENSFVRDNIYGIAQDPQNANFLESIQDSMACSLVNMSISTHPELVDTLVAQVTLLWFNYKPYSPHFWYRRTWDQNKNSPVQGVWGWLGSQITGKKPATQNVRASSLVDQEHNYIPNNAPASTRLVHKADPYSNPSPPVIFPEHSSPLTNLLQEQAYLYPVMPTPMKNKIIFSWKQYETISSMKYANIVSSMNKSLLVQIKPGYVVGGQGTRLILQKGAAEDLEHMIDAMREEFDDPNLSIPISSMFRTREEQRKLRSDLDEAGQLYDSQTGKPIAAQSSWHEVGLAFDVRTRKLNRGYASLKYEHWKWMVENGHTYGWRNLGRYFGGTKELGTSNGEYFYHEKGRFGEDVYGFFIDKNRKAVRFAEAWHFENVRLTEYFKNKYKDSISVVQSIIDNDLNFSSSDKRKKDIELERDYILSQLKEKKKDKLWVVDRSGSSSTALVFYKPQRLVIGDEYEDLLIPETISINKTNIVAQLPILGYEYPTQQYLGSGDMEATITFTAITDRKLAALQAMVKTLQDNGRGSRYARNAAAITIDNSLLNMVGFNSALVESITATNRQGSPDVYDVQLVLTEHKQDQTPDTLVQERLAETENWQRISKYVYERFFSRPIEMPIINHKYTMFSGYTFNTSYIFLENMYKFWAEYMPASMINSEIGKTFKLAEKAATTARRSANINEALKKAHKRIGSYLESQWNFTDKDTIQKSNKELSDSFKVNTLTKILKKLYNNNKTIGVPLGTVGSSVDAGLIKQAFNLEKKDTTILISEFRRVILTQLAVLYTIFIRKRIPENALDSLGIPRNLIPPEYLLSDVEVNKEDKKYVKEAATWLKASAGWVISSLSQHVSFAPLMLEFSTELSNFENGLPAYNDLRLPPHWQTGQFIDVDPDFYFYNESIDGNLTAIGQSPDYVAGALNIQANTLESLDYNTNYKAYARDIVSYNKLKIDNDEGYAEALKNKRDNGKIDSIVAARKWSTIVRDTELPRKVSWSLGREDLKEVLDTDVKDDIMKKTHPMRWNHISDDIDKVEFGVRVDDPLAPSPAELQQDRVEDILIESSKNFKQDTFRMARAFPTFKIYFIEDDTYDEPSPTKTNSTVRNFDDFYSYSAIKDIRVVRSHKIPADLCVITLTNVNGELDVLSYSNKSKRGVEKFDPFYINTKKENYGDKEYTPDNPFNKLVVVEGSKIQIRMGYSNNPEQLETLFNGQVVEVALSEGSPDLVQLTCQSYAVELVSEIKGVAGKKEEYDSTQTLLSAMICSPEVTHFGRWSRNATYEPGEIRTSRSDDSAQGLIDTLLEKKSEFILQKWNFYNKPQDDNIFAPNYDSYDDVSSWVDRMLDKAGVSGIGTLIWDALGSNKKYHPFHVTIWDIFKEMELRHPGFIAAAVPYGQRYTMFFGAPSQKYWYKPLGWMEQVEIEQLETKFQDYQDYQTAIDSMTSEQFKRLMAEYTTYKPDTRRYAIAYERKISETERRQQFLVDKAKEIMKRDLLGERDRRQTFRNYWALTSEHHIIANTIRASSYGTFNAVHLRYFEDPSLYQLQKETDREDYYELIDSKVEDIKIKADDNIEDKDTRVMQAEYFSCYGDFFARRYAIGLLMRSLRDSYKGEIIVTGMPEIKPHDICYIYDTYNDIFGPIEVEQVTHWFSLDTGFVTEIKPDLVITHNEWSTQSTIDAMWHIANNYTNTLGVYGLTALAGTVALGGIASGVVGMTAALLGGYKIVNWSQERQPVVITPLIHRHKPLTAGFDGYKFDSLFCNLSGKWERFTKDAGAGLKALWNDTPITDWIQDKVADYLE